MHFVVSNSRFLLRTGRGEVPNLASRILRLSLARLDADWREHYGHGLLLAETFVDIEAYAGTCYKASNRIELGKTKGFERAGTDYYDPHGRPKRLFIRPLHRKARKLMAAAELPDAWKAHERNFHPGCTVKPHLAQALGYEAIKRGHTVRHISIFDLVRELMDEDALASGKLLGKYLKPDLLIIDDMGLKQLPARAGEHLFEVIMRRYELRSTLMTSNRPIEDWGV